MFREIIVKRKSGSAFSRVAETASKMFRVKTSLGEVASVNMMLVWMNEKVFLLD